MQKWNKEPRLDVAAISEEGENFRQDFQEDRAEDPKKNSQVFD
jgi:hypothetical protein